MFSTCSDFARIFLLALRPHRNLINGRYSESNGPYAKINGPTGNFHGPQGKDQNTLLLEGVFKSALPGIFKLCGAIN